jgi:phosphopantothenoylcysteine decarboxylase/phosphopantothenate--cysteine ligase
MTMLEGNVSKSVLLIVTGSIAAYKSLDVIRRLRERNVKVTCVLTKGGAEFVTPLSLASLSGNPVYGDLFSLKDETEMGHIRLSRAASLIAVVPASADIIAKMAAGNADDLATATLLASDKPIVIAPAMNERMWEHPATKRNIAQLKKDGIQFIAPDAGALACGEIGQGRLAGVDTIVSSIMERLGGEGRLKGLSALVTSGPTFEAIDPVRFIGNRSSGKQGHAIAAALADAGVSVTLIAGPTSQPDPQDVKIVRVETAEEMLAACKGALPADIAVCCAAVSDWRAKKPLDHKLKKRANDSPPEIELAFNPDVLATLATLKAKRPKLVIGFAAETESVVRNAAEKRTQKGCDWIVANDVSQGKVFGKDETHAFLITAKGSEEWQGISKAELAQKLVKKIIDTVIPAKAGISIAGDSGQRRSFAAGKLRTRGLPE